MLKGGSVEKVWQPMSADTWYAPSSRSTSFIAENTGRSGHPTQKPGGRKGTGPPSNSSARFFADVSVSKMTSAEAESTPFGALLATNCAMPESTTSPVYSPARGSTLVFACMAPAWLLSPALP